MKLNNVTKNAIVAAIYIVMTILNPIGWGPLQIRISEMVCVLSF